jgi:hypothetical protein
MFLRNVGIYLQVHYPQLRTPTSTLTLVTFVCSTAEWRSPTACVGAVGGCRMTTIHRAVLTRRIVWFVTCLSGAGTQKLAVSKRTFFRTPTPFTNFQIAVNYKSI